MHDMVSYIIEGGRHLAGSVTISGSKNAALPIMAATLLTRQTCVLSNVPDLLDTRTMAMLLEYIGKDVTWEDDIVTVRESRTLRPEAPYDIVSTMRASICVMGPLLGRLGRCRVSMPGGCAFGPRPVDLHLKAMQALGATVDLSHGDLEVFTDQPLTGSEMTLSGRFGPTVLGTANAAMAAVMAQGQTIIHDAAREPEVCQLLEFLVAMGASIHGIGTSTLVIEGSANLGAAHCHLIPDRIEAGTFMALAAITGQPMHMHSVNPDHMTATLEFMRQTGLLIHRSSESTLHLERAGAIRPVSITAGPYPGFATDMQPVATALLSLAQGESIVRDPIYPSRFAYTQELNRLGASIQQGSGQVRILGVPTLAGATVRATDLRAGAALMIAGLIAEGQTHLLEGYHIERGYEDIVGKLSRLGAEIEAVHADPQEPLPGAKLINEMVA